MRVLIASLLLASGVALLIFNGVRGMRRNAARRDPFADAAPFEPDPELYTPSPAERDDDD